jgi:hypothetical protein
VTTCEMRLLMGKRIASTENSVKIVLESEKLRSILSEFWLMVEIYDNSKNDKNRVDVEWGNKVPLNHRNGKVKPEGHTHELIKVLWVFKTEIKPEIAKDSVEKETYYKE